MGRKSQARTSPFGPGGAGLKVPKQLAAHHGFQQEVGFCV